MERIRKGDERAFEEMFRAYYEPLCTFAEGYVRTFAVAEELVEDLFLKLWERRGTLVVTGSLRSYLFASIRNASLNHLKHLKVVDRARSVVLQEHGVPGMGQPPPRADEEVHRGELKVALEAAVETLPDRCRTTHLLFWRDGLSYAEIAEAMQVSTKTVENQLARAVKLLRLRLAPWS